MKLTALMNQELFYRRRRTLAAIFAVTVAMGGLMSALTLLRLHETAEQSVLAAREKEIDEAGELLRDEMRKATLNLKFNLLILPQSLDLKEWYLTRESDLTLPEEYGGRLAQSGLVTVQHILPVIQKKVIWPETGRTVILTGSRGQQPQERANPRKPLIQPVPGGHIVLGHELHRSLGIRQDEPVTFMGLRLIAHRLNEERGNQDDITVWIHLDDAQQLLGMDGKISLLMALECLCAGGPEALERVRSDVGAILPDTQVVEMGSKVLARAEARLQAAGETRRQLAAEKLKQQQLARQRQGLAALLIPALLLLCGSWIGLLTWMEARERRVEIGLLRAIGFRNRALFILFFGKAFYIGAIGGFAGCAAGALLVRVRCSGLAGLESGDLAAAWAPLNFLTAIAGGVLLVTLTSWIPALIAARSDPADVLRDP